MIRPTVKDDREGRGFSVNELTEASLHIARAKKLGFAVDLRRRSINSSNVTLLKKKSKELEAELKKKIAANKAIKPKKITKEAKKEKPVKVEKKKAVKPKKKVVEKVKASKPKVSKKMEKTIPLTDIKGLGSKTATRLEDAGVKSGAGLAKANLEKLAEKTGIAQKVLERYAAEASKLL